MHNFLISFRGLGGGRQRSQCTVTTAMRSSMPSSGKVAEKPGEAAGFLRADGKLNPVYIGVKQIQPALPSCECQRKSEPGAPRITARPARSI